MEKRSELAAEELHSFSYMHVPFRTYVCAKTKLVSFHQRRKEEERKKISYTSTPERSQ